jgi:hypothetical protein
VNWFEQRKRIRRYLRDPDGNIWSDALLLSLYNDAQRELQHQVQTLEDFQVIRLPSMYQMSYLFDWEWPFTDHERGYVLQVLFYYDAAELAHSNRWETESIAGTNATTSDEGSHWTHPFEAWYDIPATPPPFWAPEPFEEVRLLSQDQDLIDPNTRRDIEYGDRTWRTRSGEAQDYYRDETLSNNMFLYPKSSTVAYDDIVTDSDYIPDITDGYGMVLFTDEETENQENGTVISATGYTSTSDYGIAIDMLDEVDNVLMVYTRAPKDIVSDQDESLLAPFLRKYIEYAVLERAYTTNTDGRIESLAQYWKYRKDIGIRAWKIFMGKRKSDREYQLRTKGAPAMRNRKAPRLPDEYPAQW